jgi:acetate kinase
LGGLDALVFTGGIGENAAPIRAQVVHDGAWLGLTLNEAANAVHGPRITTTDSRIPAYVIATDEELMIARHTKVTLGADGVGLSP